MPRKKSSTVCAIRIIELRGPETEVARAFGMVRKIIEQHDDVAYTDVYQRTTIIPATRTRKPKATAGA